MKHLLVGLMVVSSLELEDKVKNISDVLEVQEQKKSLSLNVIRVRTSLDAGVEIPGVTNAVVSPEIEIYFTK